MSTFYEDFISDASKRGVENLIEEVPREISEERIRIIRKAYPWSLGRLDWEVRGGGYVIEQHPGRYPKDETVKWVISRIAPYKSKTLFISGDAHGFPGFGVPFEAAEIFLDIMSEFPMHVYAYTEQIPFMAEMTFEGFAGVMIRKSR